MEQREDMKAEIDLMENAVYAVVDGCMTKINPMEHGVDKIIWKNGRILDVERSHRIRLGNGQEINENP